MDARASFCFKACAELTTSIAVGAARIAGALSYGCCRTPWILCVCLSIVLAPFFVDGTRGGLLVFASCYCRSSLLMPRYLVLCFSYPVV